MADTVVAQPMKEEQVPKQEAVAEQSEQTGTATATGDVKFEAIKDVEQTSKQNNVKPEASEEQKSNGNGASHGNGDVKSNGKDNEGRSFRQHKQPRPKDKKNIKSNYNDLPESNDEDEIRRQVDFYFSDSNLPTDKYLLTETGGHKNNPFPLKEIHNFKRMRHFQPYTAVLDACKKSTIIDVTDDGMITRKVPLDKKWTLDVEANKRMLEDEVMPRTIYAKGFGSETSSSQTEIEDYFKVFGDINAVRLRRYFDLEFKGSVFIEFADVKTAEDFLALENKPAFKDQELMFKSRTQYHADKKEEYKDKPKRNFSRGGGQQNVRDNDNWRERRDNDQRRGRGDRDGRGRGRGGRGRGGRSDRNRSRDRRDRDDREDRDAADVKAEETGDDIVMKTEGASEVKAEQNGDGQAAKSQPAEVQQNGKKRAREDDGPDNDDGDTSKKVKVDE